MNENLSLKAKFIIMQFCFWFLFLALPLMATFYILFPLLGV